ncbi:MAG TPA: phasin family protein [Coleofasciculaceae cyanobacterium]
MPGFGNIVQKAFYLGVGLASYATEKAGGTLAELRVQAQKLADELVERGEMTTEEARKMVDDMVQQAQQQTVNPSPSPTNPTSEPRRIEIIDEEAPVPTTTKKAETDNVEELRKQVQAMQDELRRLRRE